MLEKYLHTLEYPKVLDQLAAHARFSASHELCLNLKPSPYFSEAQTLQVETTEARYLLSVKPDLSIGGARDVRPMVERAYRSILITPSDLLSIRQTLIAARELRRGVVKLEDKVPHLADIAYRLEECPGVINQINQCINDAAEIRNDATPNLARIRNEMDIAHSRLMEKLRRLVASERYRQYLQEGFITQRDGRYVIPLKTDFKGRIQGVVHDQSSSGATLFVEPLPVVDLNNKLKQLEAEEDEEIRRILLALTQKVAEEGKFISATVQALAEIDLLFAKARYAEAMYAVGPILTDWPSDDSFANEVEESSRITLKQARHPLLDPETVVATDLTLPVQTSMLVITGPNTGGKTVCLKLVGLMALMAQSGLHIPAKEGSTLKVFDGVYADIGDEQSLEQSLSTFSAHMTNIVHILDHSTDRSLVIFDELGAGTDPVEGAALARAILSQLLADGVTTMVATHFAELKAYAYVTEGVANASMEFNLQTLSPTYRLRLGLPGNSNAFAIASRLGLNESIIEAAEGLVSEDSKETETMLIQIRNEQEAARMERLRLEEERAEAEYYRERIEKQKTELEEKQRGIINKARNKARNELRRTRKKIRRLEEETNAAIAAEKLAAQKQAAYDAAKAAQEITSVSNKADKETPQAARRPGQPVQSVAEAEAVLDELEKRLAPQEEAAPKRPAARTSRSLRVGDQVEVPHMNAKGVVTDIRKNEIEVQLGHFRTAVKRQDVQRLAGTEEKETPGSESGSRGGKGIPLSPGLELDLRGQLSEDALHQLDSYLDQAYLAGLPFVRIIHGKGSGVLRQVVREALSDHPLISSYQSGDHKEGGDGVTVAKVVSD